MTGAAYNALRRVGARNPLRADYRGSFALLGYTGPGRPAFIKQVMINVRVLNCFKCIYWRSLLIIVFRQSFLTLLVPFLLCGTDYFKV